MSQQPAQPASKTKEDAQGARKRRTKKHKGGGHEDAPMAHDESNWLVSYADMMTLLFGFFVLMYSFSRIDQTKFEVIRKDVARYFGGQVKASPTIKKIEDEAKDAISQAGMDKSVQLIARDSELELRFLGSLHFNPGTATLNHESTYILNKLFDIIKTNIRADSVSVEGHTDDDPIASTTYPSNWELSTSRASTVVREFERYGFDPTKLTAKGYGSSRPLLPNRDSKGVVIPANQEVNRRVIVTIGFSHEMAAAVKAIKSNEFVSADTPEIKQNANTPLVRAGEGEQTWKEKVTRDISAVEDKLKLAQDQLHETEDKSRSAKKLAEMQAQLKTVQGNIVTTEAQAQGYLSGKIPVVTARSPAAASEPGQSSVKSKKGAKHKAKAKTKGKHKAKGGPAPASLKGGPVPEATAVVAPAVVSPTEEPAGADAPITADPPIVPEPDKN